MKMCCLLLYQHRLSVKYSMELYPIQQQIVHILATLISLNMHAGLEKVKWDGYANDYANDYINE